MDSNFMTPNLRSRESRFVALFAFLLALPACPPLAHSQTFNQIEFVIVTGDDDLRADSSATAILLDPSGTKLKTLILKANGQPSWNSNTMHTISFGLNPPLSFFSIGHIMITLTSQHSFTETNDSWSVQEVVVNFSNNGSGSKQLLSATGSPLVRLSGSQPSTILPLPPFSLGPSCLPAIRCVNVLTYHNDAFRTGWNSSERILNAANVRAASFGHLATIRVEETS
jgi:hypothetical protein